MPKIRVQARRIGQTTPLMEQIVSDSFRIGRQDEGEPAEIALVHCPVNHSSLEQKLIIATGDEREFSRQFAEIHISNELLKIRNTSPHTFDVAGNDLPKGEALDIHLQNVQSTNNAIEITFYDRIISLTLEEDEFSGGAISGGSLFSLASAPSAPTLDVSSENSAEPRHSLIAKNIVNGIEGDRLLELLQTMLQIFQDSPNSETFFERSAAAMIQFLQLDHVLIVFHQSAVEQLPIKVSSNQPVDQWQIHSSHHKRGKSAADLKPSTQILDLIATNKRTIYQLPEKRTESLLDIECLVASPLLNSANEVIGVVYGDRRVSQVTSMLTEAEATLVELFANGISLGLERLNHERKISEMQMRFNQFFTAELAKELESNPNLLAPRSAEVSILFADIRGFSRISERIGAELTIQWINSVMNQLSDCVLKHQGVVVDYIGDEIIAMWGAPLGCQNHRELAVSAAIDMLQCLPQLNQTWESILGEPVSVGIGINSGIAQVGNIGSDRKFKYGPLGDVVNVASRVQSSTRQLGTTLLVTESTAEKLPRKISTRKIRTVRFVNVKRPISVYEVAVDLDDQWLQLKENYEQGLAWYESGQLREASKSLASLINSYPDDIPAVQLLSDTVSSLSTTDFDSVLTLTKK